MDPAPCIHDINPSWCAYCNPRKEDVVKVRRPQQRTETTVHGSGSHETHHRYEEGYAVINVKGIRGRKNQFGRDDRIGFVHIDGYPYLWLIGWLLAHYPKLHTIQTTPKREHALGVEHRRLCAERQVRLVIGFHNPSLAWGDDENRSPFYRGQRRFLLTLEGEQKSLFEELLKFGFHSARLAERYFCLQGEEFRPQREVARAVDFPSLLPGYVSAHVNAVFCYLDPTFKASKGSVKIAETMRGRVARLRGILAQAASRDAMALRLGLERLPEGLPLSRLETFGAVVTASRQPMFQDLVTQHPSEHKVIVYRYGLADGVYRTLQEVGDQYFEGKSREWIRQLEERAFARLSIEDE